MKYSYPAPYFSIIPGMLGTIGNGWNERGMARDCRDVLRELKGINP